MSRTDFDCVGISDEIRGTKPNAPIRGRTPLERCIEIERASGDTFIAYVHDGPHNRGAMGERFGFSSVHDLLRWLHACAELITTQRPIICTSEMLERAGKPTGPIELKIDAAGFLGGFGNHA